MMRSATDLSKADLPVFSKLFDDGLERGQEAKACSGPQIGGHDDVLDFFVGHLIHVEMTGQPAPSSAVGVFDAAFCQEASASRAIGRSKGGLTTKILALTDALGNLVRIVLLPGQRFDTVGVPPLIDGLAFGALIGDTAFDSNDIVADLNERGAKAVIAQHPRRSTPLDIDREMYKWRHLIENFFCKLKEFKRIALRADKTDQSFAAMIHLAATIINSR